MPCCARCCAAVTTSATGSHCRAWMEKTTMPATTQHLGERKGMAMALNYLYGDSVIWVQHSRALPLLARQAMEGLHAGTALSAPPVASRKLLYASIDFKAACNNNLLSPQPASFLSMWRHQAEPVYMPVVCVCGKEKKQKKKKATSQLPTFPNKALLPLFPLPFPNCIHLSIPLYLWETLWSGGKEWPARKEKNETAHTPTTAWTVCLACHTGRCCHLPP